ncbi:uncharacterized protein C16orf52 homolog B-like [Paramacrobiotus metropolitanus]|uniref:uncharacterized protein C16orf52 homolog B-like n=1 Tax=Paramacrobiotus metropolitanus TaxID=2943436 RepID=UPI0024458D08|nr:uncharacterized protein C16orf52 homolog B-like [Paramacrobiotus metropolitanus]
MDKLNAISTLFFVMADVFALVSLILPDWIVSDIGGGRTRIGLLETCFIIYGRDPTCEASVLPTEWTFSLILLVLGILTSTITSVLFVISQWRSSVTNAARWIGFVGMIFFCLVAVTFPLGFSMDAIGGDPFQLPNSFQVGISYILFVLALWITVVSELIAGKVCLPHIR